MLLLTSEPAFAGSLAVNPVRVALSAKHATSALTLRNGGTQSSVVQLEVMSWSQENGKEILVPTQDILATPPIFTVAAGASQIVRVGLRQPVDPLRELSYRLILNEVPPPPAKDASALQVALRISIPVFVTPKTNSAPVLQWRADRTPQGELRVALTNTGNIHVQIHHLSLTQAGAAEPLGSQQAGVYLLPAQGRDWTLKMNSPPLGTTLRATAMTDAGPLKADVVIGERTEPN